MEGRIAPPVRIGTVLRDKWRLDALLGSGGMASVYAATHRNGSRAAIKILHPELSRDETIRRRFAREGYVANKIDHPGVMRILDDDVTDDGTVFLVMELLEGMTAKQRWTEAGRRLPLDEVLALGESLLDILARAHDAGVLHRDVKPDNVFLTDDDGVKLLDFGIARVLEGTTDATQTGAMLGTPAFMSPEQALAHWDRVDARSDLFAVGATMWTLASGRLVHAATTVPELLVAAASRPAPPFASVMPDAPQPVREVIDRALAFEKADRWPDARAMRAAVEAARRSLVDVTQGQGQAAVASRTAPPAAPSEPTLTSRTDDDKTPHVSEPAAVAIAPEPRSSVWPKAAFAMSAVAMALGVWALTRPPPSPSVTPVSNTTEAPPPAPQVTLEPSNIPSARASAPAPEPSATATDATSSTVAPSRQPQSPQAAKPCSDSRDCDFLAYCQGGFCRCKKPNLVCSGKCVDAAFDRKNCGACAHVCSSDAICRDGTCRECPQLAPKCGERCMGFAEFQVDRFNCGRCGQVCPGNGNCVQGQCRP